MMLSWLDKFLAFLRRDMLTAMRYRRISAVQFVTMLLEIAGLYFLGDAVGKHFRPNGLDYSSFLLVGSGLFGLLVIGTQDFVRVVQEAQATGMMEVLATTSTPASTIFSLMSLSAVGGRVLATAAYLVSGFLIFRIPLRNPNLLGCGLIIALALLLTIAFGMLVAAAQVAYQKGAVLVWLFGSVTYLLAGTMFPVSVLPAPLQWVAQFIPVTQVLQAARMALLSGAGAPQLLSSFGILALEAAVLLPLGIAVFSRAVQHARSNGTLSFY